MPCYSFSSARCFFVALALAMPCVSFAPGLTIAEEPKAKEEKPLDGNWHGVLKIGPAELRLVFRVSKDKDGKLKASLDSPDQGAKGLPVDSVTREGREVKLESR